MFRWWRRKGRESTPPQAAQTGSPAAIVEHPAEIVRLQARRIGVAQEHKVMLASALASRPLWANPLPTRTPQRAQEHMTAAAGAADTSDPGAESAVGVSAAASAEA
jgi:hypothetical protein